MKLILIENIFSSTVSNGRLYDTILFLEREMNRVENVKPLIYGGVVIPPNNAKNELVCLANKITRFIELGKNNTNIEPADKEKIEILFTDFRKVTIDTFKERLVTIKEMLLQVVSGFLWSSLTRLEIDIEPHEVVYFSNYSNIEY